ncbi:MAG: hypothetical protein U0903_06010 [Planctomycetales bacterium]
MTTEERLARVEKLTRRWQLGFMTLSALVLVLGAYVTYRELTVARVIRAQKLQIVGERGETLIEMKRDDAGDAHISTYNSKGSLMVSVNTTLTGGAVWLYNQLGKPIVGMQSNKFHSGSLTVSDHDGNVQGRMTGGQTANPTQNRAQMSGGHYYY